LIRVKEYIRRVISYEGIKLVLSLLFFIFFFLYFFTLNRYILVFQEQIRLFRFSSDYFTGFLAVPGGLSDYAGVFFMQFFGYPLPAALIVTLAAIAVFILSRKIFVKAGITNEFWSYVPVLFIAALHSSHLYSFSFTIAFLLALICSVLYLSTKESRKKLLILIVIVPFLYVAAGGFYLLAGAICFVHTLRFSEKRERLVLLAACGALLLLVPVAASETIFFRGVENIYTSFIPLFAGTPLKEIIIVMLCWYPALLILSGITLRNIVPVFALRRNISLLLTAAGISILSFLMLRYINDRNTDLLLGMDNDVQKSDWKGVLDKSSLIKEPNRMVLHYTNLALFKTGQLCSRLFYFPQTGSEGLWLDWEQDWLVAFFGCGSYYQLGYNSEAYRWAYEAMVAKGPNPRCLKLLALSGMVDGNGELAEKFLNILSETLFYRKWAQHYLSLIDDPELLAADDEISSARKLLIKADFINSNNFGGRLTHLLREHPENRMAFEYLMASFLLDKNLDGFAANISRIKGLDYKSLPVLFEEALAAHMSYTGVNSIPEGYSISMQTRERLEAYARAAYSSGQDNSRTAEKLYGRFGKTYWYYQNFVDNRTGNAR
jgi:hypothetical protein